MNILDCNDPSLFEKIETHIASLTPSVLCYSKDVSIPKDFKEGLTIILKASPINASYDLENKQMYVAGYDTRTITDIYRFVRFYFPDKSLIDTYNMLLNLIQEKRVQSWICGGIEKRTYGYNRDMSGGFTSEPLDEYKVCFPQEVKRVFYFGYGGSKNRYNLRMEF